MFGKGLPVVTTRGYIAWLTPTAEDSGEMFDRSVKEISSVEKYAHMCSFPGPCTLFEALWNRFEAISD